MCIKLERKLTMTKAYDKRASKPNKNYGVHGVDMLWDVIGPSGVIRLVIITDWHLKHVQEELDDHNRRKYTYPILGNLSWHSPLPIRGATQGWPCDLLSTGMCYSDSSSMAADKYFDILTVSGSDGLWDALEAYYKEIFGDN